MILVKVVILKKEDKNELLLVVMERNTIQTITI